MASVSLRPASLCALRRMINAFFQAGMALADLRSSSSKERRLLSTTASAAVLLCALSFWGGACPESLRLASSLRRTSGGEGLERLEVRVAVLDSRPSR